MSHFCEEGPRPILTVNMSGSGALCEIGGGGEVGMKRARVVIPWFGLVVCWLNNG